MSDVSKHPSNSSNDLLIFFLGSSFKGLWFNKQAGCIRRGTVGATENPQN